MTSIGTENMFENVDDGRTDDECLVILLAHLEPKGSGELKSKASFL